MTLSADGTLLAVANGGIETHPDFGRTNSTSTIWNRR